MFVEVDPAVAEADAPADAKYYSALSSRAANPDARKNSDVPRIDGTQTKIVKTFDTLRPQTVPASTPAPQPVAQPDQPEVPAVKPAGGLTPGDLTFGKPQPKPGPENVEPGESREAKAPTRQRPRTIVQAKIEKGIQVGEKYKQEGGVKRVGQVALDVKGTPFGAYDSAIVAAVQKRWYDLLEERTSVPRAGRVVLEFQLHHDGRITHLRVAESNVGDFLTLLCQKAIEDPAPYAPWPSDMRRLNRSDIREVRFTFYYN